MDGCPDERQCGWPALINLTQLRWHQPWLEVEVTMPKSMNEQSEEVGDI